MVRFLSSKKFRILSVTSIGAFASVALFQNCSGNMSTIATSALSSVTSASTVHLGARAGAQVPQANLLFKQSTADTVSSMLGINAGHSDGTFSIAQYFSNPNTSDGSDVAIPWNVGDFTGFYPANNMASQLGVQAGGYGASSVQVSGGTVGLQIHTWSAETAATSPGSIIGIVSGGSLNAKPFVQPNKILVFAMDLQIPKVYNQAPAVGYSDQYFFFADPVANKGFWFGSANFDPRGGTTEAVMFDSGTQAAIVSAVSGQSGKFSTALGGATYQSTPWTGYQSFIFGITPDNLRNAIAAVKARYPGQYSNISDDPTNYLVNGFNFDPEIAKVNGGEGWMALSYKNVQIYTLDGGTFCNGSSTVTWVCGNGDPGGGDWGDQGNGCYQRDSHQACANPQQRLIPIAANSNSNTINGKTIINDLQWSYAGKLPNMTCTLMDEPSDPNTWSDNYLCGTEDWGLQWSHSGPIANLFCTQINEPADPDTWNDNYLCAPVDYHFQWSYAGPIPGAKCVQINEPSDPDTWNDNYLCAAP